MPPDHKHWPKSPERHALYCQQCTCGSPTLLKSACRLRIPTAGAKLQSTETLRCKPSEGWGSWRGPDQPHAFSGSGQCGAPYGFGTWAVCLYISKNSNLLEYADKNAYFLYLIRFVRRASHCLDGSFASMITFAPSTSNPFSETFSIYRISIRSKAIQ